MSYVVVVFNNDNEVATVSSKWFKVSGCVLWLNCRVGKKLQNMLLNYKEPEANWISYEVRVLSNNICMLFTVNVIVKVSFYQRRMFCEYI